MTQNDTDKMKIVSLRLIGAQEMLRGFILAVTMDAQATDDILSATNSYILEHAADYDPARPFAPWAKSAAWWQIRRERTDRRRESRFLTVDSDLADKLGEEFTAATERDNIGVAAVSHCMSLASPADRDLMNLKYVDGHSVDEIATLRHQSSAAIYSALARARAGLRDCVLRMMCKLGGAHA